MSPLRFVRFKKKDGSEFAVSASHVVAIQAAGFDEQERRFTRLEIAGCTPEIILGSLDEVIDKLTELKS
jgi:hypothetical protein